MPWVFGLLLAALGILLVKESKAQAQSVDPTTPVLKSLKTILDNAKKFNKKRYLIVRYSDTGVSLDSDWDDADKAMSYGEANDKKLKPHWTMIDRENVNESSFL